MKTSWRFYFLSNIYLGAYWGMIPPRPVQSLLLVDLPPLTFPMLFLSSTLFLESFLFNFSSLFFFFQIMVSMVSVFSQ